MYSPFDIPAVPKNGTLIVPNAYEMAQRHRTRARYHERLSNDSPKGRDHRLNAYKHYRIAQAMMEMHLEQLHARDGYLTEYRQLKARRNANV